jgi:hypothetical protein
LLAQLPAVSSDPGVTKDQIENQDQQEDAADAEPASVPISAIPETTAKQEQQDQDNQDQVHRQLRSGAANSDKATVYHVLPSVLDAGLFIAEQAAKARMLPEASCKTI